MVERSTFNREIHDLATEIWAIAQTPPGGIVEDSIDRIYLMLKELVDSTKFTITVPEIVKTS